MEYNTYGRQYSADVWLEETSTFLRGNANAERHPAEELWEAIIQKLNLNVVRTAHCIFWGGGQWETLVYVLSESHLAIHTYPEHGFIAIDLFTCGNTDPAQLESFLHNNKEFMGIQDVNRICLERWIRKAIEPQQYGPPDALEPEKENISNNV